MPTTPRAHPNTLSSLEPRERVKELMKRALWDVYTHPKYSFLSEFREILWENVEILWEGMFGVIVQSPDTWVGLKVMKLPHDRANAQKEFDTQESFFEIVEHLQVWKTPKYFRVPKVPFQLKKYKWLPAVAVIEGNSLLSIYLKRKFHQQFRDFFQHFWWKDEEIEETIIDLKDFEVKTLLEYMGMDEDTIWLSEWGRLYISGLPEILWQRWKRFVGESPLPWQQPWASLLEQMQRKILDFLQDFELVSGDERPLVWGTIRAAGFKKTTAQQLLLDIRNLDAAMRALWYNHNDLSIANIMIWKDGKVYIIDFGNSIISGN